MKIGQKSLSLALIFLIPLTTGILPKPAEAASSLPISASSAILIDSSSRKVIYKKTPFKKRAPASTTKVLTAMVVLDHLRLDKVVTVPGLVTRIEPSKVYLKPGEKFRVRDLVSAMLINSANDAAEALGVITAGSRSKFSHMLNRKARKLGAKNSHFVHASGLPAPGQYSTAYDMSLIVRASSRYSFIVKTLKKKKMTIQSRAGRKIYLKNHNKMLWRDSREIIGKTGWTRKARHCFVGHIRLGSRKMFVSILGSSRLWKDLKALVDSQYGRVLLKKERVIQVKGVTPKKLQLALRRSGSNPGPVDGRLGPKTMRAIKRFQRTQGLRVDGIVGPKTWAKLKVF